MAPALSLVLPVYDEESVIERTLAEVMAFLEGLELAGFEVVCVDDGSQDGSRAILEAAAEKDARVRCDFLPENRGKGAAVKQGMLMAEGERVLFMDADLSTPLEEIPRFLGALDSGYDVVIGNRRAPGSSIDRRQPLIREVMGAGFSWLARLLLAPGIQDFTCGFKAFNREPAREIFRRCTQERWAFDAELVVIAHQLGYRMVQVPVTWRHEEGTKVRVASAALSSLRELFVIRWRRMRGRYR